MKKLMLSTALVVGLIGATFAQQTTDTAKNAQKKHHNGHTRTFEKKTPEERARLFTASLDKQLNLSDAQEKEIYTIQLENARKMEAIRKQHQAGEKKQHMANKEHLKGADRIQNVLTDEQRVTYQKIKEERRKKMKEHGVHHQRHMNSSEKDTSQNKNSKQKN